jgi:hypothetical protein
VPLRGGLTGIPLKNSEKPAINFPLAVPSIYGIIIHSRTVKPNRYMRRTGKIARLPAAVREEINRRLDDGQKSKTILPWLNALPEVKAVVDAEFGGNFITKHNLSEWNTGGYAAWAEKQRLRESVDSFLEDAASLKAVTEGQLTESMGDHVRGDRGGPDATASDHA